MGVFSFELPDELEAASIKEFSNSYLSGGPDTMPFYSKSCIHGQNLVVEREEPESALINCPLSVGDFGQFFCTSSTLMLKETPYKLLVELARGKINQLRSYMADWGMGGLKIPEYLQAAARKATLEFGKCFQETQKIKINFQAQKSLELAYEASGILMQEYMSQIFALRHSDNQPIESGITGRVSTPLNKTTTSFYSQAFNHAQAGFNWKRIEISQGEFNWVESDSIVESCLETGMEVIGGPVLNGIEEALPDWLVQSTMNSNQIATAMVKFLDAVIRRYQTKVHRWIVCSNLNSATFLDLNDETLFRICSKLAETAKQINNSLETIIGIGVPWGSYIGQERRDFSPFTFADNICRAGLNLAALDIEIIMGSGNAGSYCRDLLETSRILDLYALIGMPLTVTLGYPSAVQTKSFKGTWHGSPTQQTQADWATNFSALALSKRYIQSIQWVDFQDSAFTPYPDCGLVNLDGSPKESLAKIHQIRTKHLR